MHKRQPVVSNPSIVMLVMVISMAIIVGMVHSPSIIGEAKASASAGSLCTDSDGSNIYTKGTVTVSGSLWVDYCGSAYLYRFRFWTEL